MLPKFNISPKCGKLRSLDQFHQILHKILHIFGIGSMGAKACQVIVWVFFVQRRCPKFLHPVTKIHSNLIESVDFDQNRCFSSRTDLNLSILFEKSDIFNIEVAPRSDFIWAQFYKKCHSETTNFQLWNSPATQR